MNDLQNKFDDSLPKFHQSVQTPTGRLGFWLLVGAVAALAIAFPAIMVREFYVHSAPNAPFEARVPEVGGGNAIDQTLRSSGGGRSGMGSNLGATLEQRQPGTRVVARPNSSNFVFAIPVAGAQGGRQLQTVLADPPMNVIAPNDPARVPGAPIETFSILPGPIQTAPITPGPVEAVPFRYPRALPGTALSNIDDNNLQTPASR